MFFGFYKRSISSEEKESIERGLKDLEYERIQSHEAVKRVYEMVPMR